MIVKNRNVYAKNQEHDYKAQDNQDVLDKKKYFGHYSVLKEEILEILTGEFSSNEKKFFLDGTFGGGGHSLAIANRSENFSVFSIDQDLDAFNNGNKKIRDSGFENRVTLLHGNFVNFQKLLDDKFVQIKEHGGFDGILLDLGVSSHHFDDYSRGFSFRAESILDMRMDVKNNELTAYDIVNDYSEKDLFRILTEYGEEKFAKIIVKNILEERAHTPIRTTKDLENIVFHSYPKTLRHKGIHPATKTFQALRIEVNDELGVLERVIMPLIENLNHKGRLAIISFHSLEDRIVKHVFNKLVDKKNSKYKNVQSDYSLVSKKPIVPSKRELIENARSRSAKLRVIAKA